MTPALPSRADVAEEYTWNIASIFASEAEWEAAFQRIESALPGLARFEGRLAESAAMLRDWLHTTEELSDLLGRVFAYSRLQADADTSNQQALALANRAIGLGARYGAAMAFAYPELLAIDPARIEAFMQESPDLERYRHFFANVQRQRAHVRSAEVENLLAQASEPLGTSWKAYGQLVDSDLDFGSVSDSQGELHQVAQGTLDTLLQGGDRTLRQRAWRAYADGYLGMKNTLAVLLTGNIQTDVFWARTYRYDNALEAALSVNNIPVEVYHTVIDACRRHLPIWHRYWEVRRRALGLEKLAVCDIFAPLTDHEPHVPYAQAVEWIAAGLAPLGADYVQTARAGLTSERWVDIYPNRGKRSGAYSGGSYGTSPFILMSYTNTLESMSTLTHELGHSMHSYLSRTHQPFVYGNYSIFVGEVASNFNQALVRAHLLAQQPERAFQIAILEEAMRNFHRYFFLMPILAQFELHVHTQVEQGQALTADGMSAHLLALFREGYGAAIDIAPEDEPRVGITWAQFHHLYMNFYVYQYASGIAAAHALAEPILAGEAGAAERYLDFLKAGSSRYPIDAVKLAGIDMTTPEPMERAFAVLEGFVARLEELL
jgi:oligoendopeptidase F